MGFTGYMIVSHGDHIHVAASRICLDGSVVSDAHDWRRSESLIRDIERDFGLRQIEASHLLEPERAGDHRKAPTMARIALAERGKASPSAQVRSEEHTSELQSLMRISSAVFCLKKKK